MAIYHLHVGFVNRSTGRSSVQSAAYICAEKLHEDYRDKDVNYSNRSGDVVCSSTIAPEHSKYKDLSVWNAIENFENRYAENHYKSEETKNNYLASARTARTIVLALPKELSNECNKELIEKFARENFLSRNLISTYAIHNAEGNPHAHLQVSLRAIGEDGEFIKRKDTWMYAKSTLLKMRTSWADMANETLAREGINERITEKSYEDLGINLSAERHRGWYSSQLGFDSAIAQKNLEILKKNEKKILADPSIILDVLNEKKAAFTQKDILREVRGKVFDEKNISVIFEKTLQKAIFVGESIKGDFLYTGEKYQQLESNVLSKFDFLSSQTAKTHCSEEAVSSILSKYNYLSSEQKEAVTGLTRDDNFGILLGKAGAGKTTTMRAISEIYGQSGSRVIGMSISALAAENLGKDAAIESETIASWKYRWELYETANEKFLSFDSVVTDGVLKQLDWYNDLQRNEKYQLKSGDVIIVDEAGMVGAQEWETILNAAEKFCAKVITVGDDNQFKPISAGDCLRQFVNQKNNVYELNEIRRQKENWQIEASVAFSKMNVEEALEKYEHHGKIHVIDNAEIYKRIAEKYLEIEKIGTAAILCATNKECTAINDGIRSLKKERGELGETVCSVQTTSNNHLSRREFSENDKIIFLENNRKLGVRNGQTAIVSGGFPVAFEGADVGVLIAQMENGNHLAINTWEYSKIDHAYATTLHKSQGKTYDNTILLASKRGVMDAEATYVGMTRHRDNVDVYYSNSDFGSFKELASSISKYSHKDLLADYKHIENLGKNLNKGEHRPRARVLDYQNLRSEMVALIEDGKGRTITYRVNETTWKEFNELKARKVKTEKEILGNYESHKLYLDQLGITKEKLEISAGIRPRPMTRAELEAKSTVMEYAKIAQETRTVYENIKKKSFNITKHKDYEKYCEIREIRNSFAEKILSNKILYKEFVNEMSREYFISFKGMERQIDYGMSLKTENSKIAETSIEKTPGATPTSSKSENDIFAKIESAKNGSVRKNEYKGTTLANRLQFNKFREGYSTIKSIHLKHFGYEPHVSKAMVYAYGGENNIPEKLYNGNLTHEYASMLAENKLKSAGETEISLDIAKESIKQAICFQVLKQANNTKELTPEIAADLHTKSSILSLHLTKDNMHVLKNKELMREVCTEIQVPPEKDKRQIDSMNFDRLIKLDQKDLLRKDNNKEQEITRFIEISKGFEINHF